jgi:biopolymer transport protein ExbD
MGRARLPEMAELDIVPIMSLIVHLIPMLMLCVRFTLLAQVPTAGHLLPSVPAASPQVFVAQEENVVSVRITPQGFIVGGLGTAENIACSAQPCTPESYDLSQLSSLMVAAKQLHPNETRVVVAPDPEISYEVVVLVMAATRERVVDTQHEVLFPDVLLAEGVQKP